jgi:trimeric autotransporter adhesin
MKNAKTVLLAALLAAGMACGYSAKPTTPPAAGTMPNIAALVPNSATAGSSLGPNGLMVTGANFNGNATINWNGTALTTAFVSGTQLTATVPDADVAAS